MVNKSTIFFFRTSRRSWFRDIGRYKIMVDYLCLNYLCLIEYIRIEEDQVRSKRLRSNFKLYVILYLLC